MNNYRIIGALKHDGSRVDECLIAYSAAEAEAKAQKLGVLVTSVEFIPASAPDPPVRRPVRPRTDRNIIRGICMVCAVLLLAAGGLVLLFAFIGFLGVTASQQPGDSASLAGLGLITGGMMGMSLLLSGSLLFLLLYIEEWLWDSRAYLARMS